MQILQQNKIYLRDKTLHPLTDQSSLSLYFVFLKRFTNRKFENQVLNLIKPSLVLIHLVILISVQKNLQVVCSFRQTIYTKTIDPYSTNTSLK